MTERAWDDLTPEEQAAEIALGSRLDGPVHEWFELTYAKYLTVPRSILQSMPLDWQSRFAECLHELDEQLPEWRPREGRYWVHLRDRRGRRAHDPFDEYRHSPVYSAEDVAKMRGPI